LGKKGYLFLGKEEGASLGKKGVQPARGRAAMASSLSMGAATSRRAAALYAEEKMSIKGVVNDSKRGEKRALFDAE